MGHADGLPSSAPISSHLMRGPLSTLSIDREKRAQLLVIGKDGRVALRQSGAANNRALAEVFREIDRLRNGR